MRNPLRLIRSEHWFTQKLSPLAAVSYALLWAGDVEPGQSVLLLPTILAICCVAAYGHVINDWFDIESDAKAGKPNTLAGRSPSWFAVAVGTALLVGFVLMSLSSGSPVLLTLLAIDYLLPTLYSIPPFRLKERGFIGVISDALAAHIIPTIIVAVAVRDIASGTLDRWLPLTAAAAVWAGCLGLRGILIHQALDRDADLAAGVRTFGAARSPDSIRNIVVRFIVPVEAVGAAAFVLLLPGFSYVLAAALAVFLAGEAARLLRGLRMPMVHLDQSTERYVPLVSNELYEVWLPGALSLQLALNDPGYFPVPLLHLLLFSTPILRTVRMLGRFAARSVRGGGLGLP